MGPADVRSRARPGSQVAGENSFIKHGGTELVGTPDADRHHNEVHGATATGGHGADHSSHRIAFAFANFVWNWKHLILFVWPVLAVVLAPFAARLMRHVSPLDKHAPAGTESAQAMDVFEKHFSFLMGMQREMVVIRCTRPCSSAATVESRGIVQIIDDLVKRFGDDHPGSLIHLHSYFTYGTKLEVNPMLAHDRQSILVQWAWRVPTELKFKAEAFVEQMQEVIDEINESIGVPAGLTALATGPTFLKRALRLTLAEELPKHDFSVLPFSLSILAYRLKSVRMVIFPLISIAICAPIAFGLVYFVALHTTVLSHAPMMMILLCAALSLDYSLFTLTRYSEERAAGAEVKEAVITTIVQSGHVVLLSGCVLIVAYAANLVMPSTIKSFCVAASTMIVACIGVQLTFVPAMLAVCPCLGPNASTPRGLEELTEIEAPRAYSALEEVGPEHKGPRGRSHHESEPHDDLGALASPHCEDASQAWAQAAPHMRGTWFWLGGRLTRFPLNVIVPLIVYTVMMPLTLRLLRYRPGHAFELEVPRKRQEWKLALQIQKDYSGEIGCFFPMLIIATADAAGLPTPLPPDLDPNATNATGFFSSERKAAMHLLGSVPEWLGTHAQGTEPEPMAPVPELDVRGQRFFDANCAMVNELIKDTKNRTFALSASDFQSVTFHGETGDHVNCLSYWQTHMYRHNFLTRKFFFTSQLFQQMWDELVSASHDAMLTMLYPTMDAFSPTAFAMVTDVRKAMHEQTEAAARSGELPGLTFMTFSATSVIMDTISSLTFRLPIAFLTCVLVCFTLIAISFGAAFIPVKLFFTVILPITWAYGAALYVFEDGALAWTGLPGISPTGDAGLVWLAPIFTLTLMLGLALDYDVFLFTRVWEFRESAFGDCESIQLGLAATGPIITSAGMIFAVTFSSMMLASIPLINHMGFLLVFSILIDTFVVRTVLVPAMLSLSPGLNYWPSHMPDPKYTWLSAPVEPGSDSEGEESEESCS